MYKFLSLMMMITISGCALDANRNVPVNSRTDECVRMLRMLENTTVYQKVNDDKHFKLLVQECERSIR